MTEGDRMTLEGKGGRKILWAVDPFSSDEDVLKTAAWSIRALVGDGGVRIEPVYVWPRAASDIPLMREPSEVREFVRREGQEAIEHVLTRIKVPGVEPFRVLANFSSSVREEARELVAYAKDVGAELIVVSSRGKKGVKRWLFGSFAETLSLSSDIPLLILHPRRWKKAPDFKTILFPTDFSAESLDAYGRVLDFAAERGSRVVLFHQVGAIGYPVVDMAFAVYTDYRRVIKDELEADRKLARDWAEQGQARGVRVKVILERSRKASIPESILERAKRLGSMIALASHSGPVASVLMGSTTRQVVRHSEQPVWVIHPRQPRDSRVGPLTRVTEQDIEADLLEHGKGRSA